MANDIGAAQSDIWIFALARGVRTRLTFGPGANTSPIWSKDGKWIAYASGRNGRSNIYRKLSDGSGAEELLVSADQQLLPADWSRDGKYLLYARGTPGPNWEIWALPLHGERMPFQVISHATTTLFVGSSCKLSPNGHWIVYGSDESGTAEIFVTTFGGGQGKWQVSSNGGSRPNWSSNGKEIYYMDAIFNMLAIPVREVGGALEFGAAQTLISNWSAPGVLRYLSVSCVRRGAK